MPELPEVETTKAALQRSATNRQIAKVRVVQPSLRWPVPVAALIQGMQGYTIDQVSRRSKYLLLRTTQGRAMVHLGMSGSMRIVRQSDPIRKHDHIQLDFADGGSLRFHDPRRFGSWHWIPDTQPWREHPLIAPLGPEPLEGEFTGDYLYQRLRGRKVAIKSALMNAAIVVGVGNIYANEALFLAGIHPRRSAGRISRSRINLLVDHVRGVLQRAIEAGGTTLNDFLNPDGEPGYFAQTLLVYGREGQPCPRCRHPITRMVIGQRATYYCKSCQR